MFCKICAYATIPFFSSKIIGKYEIQYYQCQNCGFIQTEEPYWLSEAYTEAITQSDIGLVSRNIFLARLARTIIFILFNNQARFVDYGGGYGLFVRLMRDAGLDFYRFDKFCANLFATGFEADLDTPGQYELVTAFEVFEHLSNPLLEIEKMLQLAKNILFTTELVPLRNPKPDDWYYYGFEHGQHVSFYTTKSLSIVAQKFQLNLYSDGKFLHLLTEKKIPFPLFSIISNYRAAVWFSIFLRKKSLLTQDYFKLTGKHLN